jgi:OmpR-family two-component system manganese-sensing sensor histidine kinase
LRLRRRLSLQGGGFALLLLAAFSGSLYWGIALQRLEDQHKELRRIAASAAAQHPLILHEAREAAGARKFRGEPRLVELPGFEQLRVQWFDAQGQLLSQQGTLAIPSVTRQAPAPAPAPALATAAGEHWQRWSGGLSLRQPVLVREPGAGGRRRLSGFVRVALSDRAVHQDLERLRRGLLLGAVVTALAALLVGRRMLAGAFAPLQRQIEALQRFTADASHELRHPLTSLRTLLASVPEPQRSSPQLPWSDLDRLAREMAELLDDLLFLARQEQAGAELSLAAAPRFDLLELLEDLVSRHAPQAARQGIRLRLDPSPQQHGLPIQGEPEQLQRLFTNLLLNALRHSPEGSTVSVRVRPTAQRLVVVEVVDGGPGIAPQEQGRVFERFWRGRDRGGQSGLGLAIARSIARRHGGDLRVGESRPGHCVLRVELASAAAEFTTF